MERLAQAAPLVPSSMNATNTVSDNPALAMTAAGSPSILPWPDSTDVLPQPQTSASLEVNPQRDRIDGNPAPGGSGPWTDITETGNGGWKQL
jgi:hypothetical protein